MQVSEYNSIVLLYFWKLLVLKLFHKVMGKLKPCYWVAFHVMSHGRRARKEVAGIMQGVSVLHLLMSSLHREWKWNEEHNFFMRWNFLKIIKLGHTASLFFLNTLYKFYWIILIYFYPAKKKFILMLLAVSHKSNIFYSFLCISSSHFFMALHITAFWLRMKKSSLI